MASSFAVPTGVLFLSMAIINVVTACIWASKKDIIEKGLLLAAADDNDNDNDDGGDGGDDDDDIF